MKQLRLILPALLVVICTSSHAFGQTPTSTDDRLRELEVSAAATALVEARQAVDRDVADLAAQQGMEIAAKRMADFTLWQVIIGAIGSAVVAASLYQSMRAIRHSADALDQNAKLIELTKTNGELQLKAYPSRTDVVIRDFTGNPCAELTYKNFGQTPCIYCDLNVEVDYYEGRFADAPWVDITDPLPNDQIGLAPDDISVSFGFLNAKLTSGQIQKIDRNEAALIVRAEVVWKDVFGNVYRRRHVWAFSGESANDRSVVVKAGSQVLLRREEA